MLNTTPCWSTSRERTARRYSETEVSKAEVSAASEAEVSAVSADTAAVRDHRAHREAEDQGPRTQTCAPRRSHVQQTQHVGPASDDELPRRPLPDQRRALPRDGRPRAHLSAVRTA